MKIDFEEHATINQLKEWGRSGREHFVLCERCGSERFYLDPSDTPATPHTLENCIAHLRAGLDAVLDALR